MLDKNDWEMFKELIKTQDGKERFLELVGTDLLNELGLQEKDKLDMEIEDFINSVDGKFKS